MWTADSINTSFNGDPRSKLSDLLQGTAHRPFVQRALIPALTQAVYGVVPDSWKTSITQYCSLQPKIQKELRRLGWEEEYIPQYLVALALSFFFLALFPFIIRSTVRLFYHTDEWIINIFPFLMMLGLPVFFHVGTRYIYDFPSMSLFALGFFLMVQKKWSWYYFVLLVGLVNKETMIVLALLFAYIHHRNIPASHYWGHLLTQVGLFVIVRGSINWFFKNNPGQLFEFHLFGNIRILADLWTFQQLLIWGIFFFLLFYQYNKKPAVMRKAFVAAGIPFLSLMLLFCYIDELRDGYEFYPFTAYLMLHTMFFSVFQVPWIERKLIDYT